MASARPQSDEAIRIREELEQQVDAFRATIQRIEADLHAVLAKQIDEMSASSNLSIDEKLRLRQDLERQTATFLQDGLMPEERKLARAAQAFAKSSGAALRICCDAHTKAAEGLGKLKDLDGASAVLLERDEMRMAYDLDSKRERAQLRLWFPVGTRLECLRTRDGAAAHKDQGTVVENDGRAFVIEVPSLSGPLVRWRFQGEAGGTLRFVDYAKKDPKQRGGDIENCAGTLRVTENNLTGNYSWNLLQRIGGRKRVIRTRTSVEGWRGASF